LKENLHTPRLHIEILRREEATHKQLGTRVYLLVEHLLPSQQD
jgi:hypothetical protein